MIAENFTTEELERLKDPAFAKKFRHALEHDINVSLRFPMDRVYCYVDIVTHRHIGLSHAFDS